MKRLLLLLLPVMFWGSGCGQKSSSDVAKKVAPVHKKAKEFEWPKPIRDSQYFEETGVDTLWGTIELQVSGGTMTAQGFVRSSMTFQCSMAIYTKEDQARIDSFEKSANIFTGTECIGTGGLPDKVAYIYTDKGIKRVDGNFTFTAKRASMNYNKELRKVIRFGSFNHRGVIVSLTNEGYEALAKICKDKDEVDAVIDEHLKTLTKSLNRIRPLYQ